MQLEIIRSAEAMYALKHDWNALLHNSACNVPFLRHEYLSAWWETLGGGEWPAGELYIVVGRQPDGNLAALAPLFAGRNRAGQSALMLLGSIEISDYLDLIALPQALEEFCQALLTHLDDQQPPTWEVLDLCNLLESSPTLPALQAAAQERGWNYSEEVLSHCPHILLPGDFEVYLTEQVDKKQRHEIRRKMRRAEGSETPVRWYIVQDEAALEDEMEAFLILMANDPEKERFLTPMMRTQMKSAMRSAFNHGWLQLAFLEVGSSKAAAYLNFDYNNHIWVYNSGLDPTYRELSPGWVLLGCLLEWANQQKRGFFDFMRGDEEYKYRFGALDRRIVRACISR